MERHVALGEEIESKDGEEVQEMQNYFTSSDISEQ